MKKFTTAGLLLALSLSLAACGGGGEKPASAPADQNQSTATNAGADDAKKVVQQNCATCHGQNLEGGVGPALKDVGSRLDKDGIAKVIKEGRPPGMPGGLIPDEKQVEAVAAYLAEQK
ncbi:cytochrome c [Aneurinibacillus sp. BA2021]|nr:cytochrome c [Aneurinibacillus sp. BA2021]